MFATVGPGHIQEALYPAMGTPTPHVHGGWDSGTCLGLGRGEGDPYLGPSFGSVSSLLCDSEYDVCLLSGFLFPLTAK